MNTQNVKTAAAESTETWGKTLVNSCSATTAVQQGIALSGCGRYFPDAERMTVEAYHEMAAARGRTGVQEISADRYTDQLEVMPPQDWKSLGEGIGESFKSAERWSGDVTSIFASVQGRYFEFRDRHTLTQAEILERVIKEVFSKEQA